MDQCLLVIETVPTDETASNVVILLETEIKKHLEGVQVRAKHAITQRNEATFAERVHNGIARAEAELEDANQFDWCVHVAFQGVIVDDDFEVSLVFVTVVNRSGLLSSHVEPLFDEEPEEVRKKVKQLMRDEKRTLPHIRWSKKTHDMERLLIVAFFVAYNNIVDMYAHAVN